MVFVGNDVYWFGDNPPINKCYKALYANILTPAGHTALVNGSASGMGGFFGDSSGVMIASQYGGKHLFITYDFGVEWTDLEPIGVDVALFEGGFYQCIQKNTNGYYRLDPCVLGENLTNFTKGEVLMIRAK